KPLFLICVHTLFYFFAIHIELEAFGIQSNVARISSKESTGIRRVAPNSLLPVKYVMHLPEAALQSSGFRRVRGIARVQVIDQRKVTKDEPKLLFVIALELVNRL